MDARSALDRNLFDAARALARLGSIQIAGGLDDELADRLGAALDAARDAALELVTELKRAAGTLS